MNINSAIIDQKLSETSPSLYTQCLQLRRDVFISQLKWNLQEKLGCEFDEYDTPAAVHVAALLDGRVIGCMRLMRTDTVLGASTYMILDAHRGKISNLPSQIMNEEIISSTVWEASRIAISDLVEREHRNRVFLELIKAGMRYVNHQGGDTLLGLMNPAFMRIFARAKLDVERFGRIADQRDGRVCVLRMDTSQVAC